MKIIFCSDPTSPDNPDSIYIDEVAAATRAGIQFLLLDYEALADRNNAARAVRDIPVHQTLETAVYRGWHLSTRQYAALYDALRSRGIQLINNVQQFKNTQHLPQSYPIIKEKTPRSVWMETDGKVAYEAIMQVLIPFYGQPLILRDYAQTEKHYWNQACYISSASDSAAVRNTVGNFLKLRGKKLEGGLVFREFVDFEMLTDSSPSVGMPLIKEYRIFYMNNLPVTTVHYWNSKDYEATNEPDPDLFRAIARQVRSRFFTMDVAQSTDGEWLIIDLGDAQIANLPVMADLDAVYHALAGAH
ncbi:MAG: ATP-grasp domain-containing protein [Anaerolineae bacterium]|nr:ATP-grasp domain-containing protein [Anaerolineae bacterium]MDQ7035049.1 ATP-grasp domain-containing protein [Anaerolineae bacterium]